MKDIRQYEDIISLNQPKMKHPRMACADRAAQFAPFAALTGFEDVIYEKGRITSKFKELDEQQRELLDQKIQMAFEQEPRKEMEFLYFSLDKKKQGGTYSSIYGVIQKIDPITQTLYLTSGVKLQLAYIMDIKEMEFE